MDRSGEPEPVVLTGAHPLLPPSPTGARLPVAVLVNGATASTSELLAAALRGAAGARLVGERTYGKGLTQRVVGLRGGWTLLVSSVKLRTPAGAEYHKVGLRPDAACRPAARSYERFEGGRAARGGAAGAALPEDPCLRLAVRQLLEAGRA